MLEGEIVNLRAREVQRGMGGRYLWSLAAEVEWLREKTAKAPDFYDARVCIETKEGRTIGTTGLHDVSAENRSAWLGIMIGEKDWWSQGFGTDAIVTLLRQAFGQMNLHRVELQVYADNGRGIACYRKCGFVEEVRMRRYRYRDGEWIDALTMGVLRDEFKALHGLVRTEEVHA
jgi:RimJ/RimL family protein N-acetyltransferase